MSITIGIHLIDYASEPDIAVLGGPLHMGYAEYIAGNPERARVMIIKFLADVYANPSRIHEQSTEYQVLRLCRRRGIPIPADKYHVDRDLLMVAAGIRYDRVHLPVLLSILNRGYQEDEDELITMTEKQGRYLVWDGKNRCSILAAMGWESVPGVVML